MDPQTIDTIVGALKLGGGLVVCSGVATGVILSCAAGYIKFHERKEFVKMFMPAYESGNLKERPTIFNIYRISNEYNAKAAQSPEL